jgi:hypothetical protein
MAQRDRDTKRQKDRRTKRQRDRGTERQRDRETERQRDRETERKGDTNIERHIGKDTNQDKKDNQYIPFGLHRKQFKWGLAINVFQNKKKLIRVSIYIVLKNT